MKLKSPVTNREFVWLAQYLDGTELSEFNFEDKQENSFYSINKQKLVTFGLVGHGMHLCYGVATGFFKIGDYIIEIGYMEENKEYKLCGQRIVYNDIVQFKRSTSELQMAKNSITSFITEHNLGYKVKDLEINGLHFNFQNLLVIPLTGRSMFMSCKLLCQEQDLNGCLYVKRNGVLASLIQAPLVKGKYGYTEWEIRLPRQV